MHISTDIPARSRPPSLSVLDDDTVELFLTPEQIYQLERSARLAVGREPRERSRQPPRLKVINTPLSKVHAVSVAPIIVTPHAPGKDVRQNAPPLAKVTDRAPPEAPKKTIDIAASRALEPARRRVPTSAFPRGFFRRALALLVVPAIAIAAMIEVSAFHLPVMHLPASGIERTSLSAAPVSHASESSTERADPAIAEPLVRFANPFDRSEVFEFPPRTTRQEAREAVAQILIDRANQRRNRVRTVGR